MVYKMIDIFSESYFFSNISMLFPYWVHFSAKNFYTIYNIDLFRYYSSFKFVRHLNSFCLSQKFFSQSHNK